MPAEAAEQLPAAAVPDLHGAVLPGLSDPPAVVVGAERHGVDLPVVSPESLKLSAVLHVPDLDRILLTPRRQPPAVRAKGHVQTRTGDSCAKGEASCVLPVWAQVFQSLRSEEH